VKGLNEIVIQTQEKVESLLKLDSQPLSSNSKIIPTDSQPPLSVRNQPSPAPSEFSESPSVVMDRSIEQMLEEFPAYSEPTLQNTDKEEITPICKEVDTPFLQPRKFAKKRLETGDFKGVPVSNSFSGLPSEPSEFSESSEDSVVEHMAVMKENLSRGLFSNVVKSPHPKKLNNTWDLFNSPRKLDLKEQCSARETELRQTSNQQENVLLIQSEPVNTATKNQHQVETTVESRVELPQPIPPYLHNPTAAFPYFPTVGPLQYSGLPSLSEHYPPTVLPYPYPIAALPLQ